MLELDKKQVIITSSIIIETPIGEMIAYATENGICLLEFTDRKNMERQMQGLSTLAEINLTDRENRHIRLLKEELSEYFAGKLTTFSV